MIDFKGYNINSMSLVHEQICIYYGVDYLYPFLRKGDKKTIYIRQMFHFICYKVCNKNITSYTSIGRYLDDILVPFEHGTVMNSCKRIKGYMSYDIQVCNDIENILNMLPKI